MKLPACYDKSRPRNPDCPICDEEGLSKLAEEVPWSHHVNSTIVCAISGKIMNEDNQPMVFPNGNVYSREVCFLLIYTNTGAHGCSKALEDMAEKNEGEVTCPRSGVRCHFNELRKVYIS